jgi:hypothetical protein
MSPGTPAASMEATVSDETRIDMTLKVDDQDIPIGRFVEEIVSQGILGMINSLKGVDEPEKIEITIEIK